MKKYISKTLAVCSIAASLIAASSSALTLTMGDQYMLGTYVPGEPASQMDEEMNVQHLVDLYNGDSAALVFNGRTFVLDAGASVPAPDLPGVDFVSKDESTDTTGIDVSGATYVLAKYDGPSGGVIVWYVADLTTVDFQAKAFGKDGTQYGLSHISFFTAGSPGVPDGGTTLALLGVAVAGMGMLRRRLNI
ncbi:MAG TPA: VPDSG-CTERM sorting domain-containing protein [Verrucomicrobiae bacterium]|nr:VPDSG-CTERM sorting domain-containing protein [Verrucomicrobiae bacterium]